MKALLTAIDGVDKRMAWYFRGLKLSWLRGIFSVITHIGDGPLWVTLYCLAFVFLKDSLTGRIASMLIAAEVTGLIIIVILRYLIKRARPDRSYTSALKWQTYSFPSHHGFRVFLLAFIGGAYLKEIMPWFILGAIY